MTPMKNNNKTLKTTLIILSILAIVVPFIFTVASTDANVSQNSKDIVETDNKLSDFKHEYEKNKKQCNTNDSLILTILLRSQITDSLQTEAIKDLAGEVKNLNKKLGE